MVMVKGDPLGKAFGVTAFHKCQIRKLLVAQLIPYTNSHRPTVIERTSSCESGNIRKKSNPDIETNQLYNKQIKYVDDPHHYLQQNKFCKMNFSIEELQAAHILCDMKQAKKV